MFANVSITPTIRAREPTHSRDEGFRASSEVPQLLSPSSSRRRSARGEVFSASTEYSRSDHLTPISRDRIRRDITRKSMCDYIAVITRQSQPSIHTGLLNRAGSLNTARSRAARVFSYAADAAIHSYTRIIRMPRRIHLSQARATNL